MSSRDDRDMNCKEIKQAIAADPSFDGCTAHLANCAKCSAYRTAMQELDGNIAQALALNVPELNMPELPDIDTTNVVTLPARRIAPAWFALAATVVAAAVIGIRTLGGDLQYESLADEIVAHLDHEPYALRVTDIPVSEERLRAVVSHDTARMNHSAGLVTYAQTCPINGRDVPHLVIQGESGPVTILLMPEEYVSEAIQISGENINGVILPVGKGSVAIIGESDERLDRIQEKVVDSVTWDT